MPVQILHADAQVVTGRWNDLYVESIRVKFVPELVKQTNLLQAAAARLPGLERMATISLFHGGFAMQSVDVDSLHAETMRSIQDVTKAGAAVLLARGFGAAVARSLYAGYSLVKPLPFPMTMVDTVAKAAAFVAPHLNGPPRVDDVVGAVEEVDRHGR